LGHLREMCEGSGLSAEIDFPAVPILPFVGDYLAQKSFPGGTVRNWNSYGHLIHFDNEIDSLYQRHILADPQTSGGLLIAVEQGGEEALQGIFKKHQLDLKPIGRLIRKSEKLIAVK
jgi:selenide, water dikinase